MDYTALVKDCLKKRPIAQKQLYDHFAPLMMGVCYRYTKSVIDAEDVLQEGFVRVFQYLDSYKNTGELGAWIRRIMVTTALNYLKRHRKYRAEMVFAETPLHPLSDDNPVVKLDAKDLSDLIRQLPTGYQTIFNLHAVEGFTHVEIGQMLGISEGTSKSQYSRARHLLSEWLHKYSSMEKQTAYARK
jgi:RNA polymerase sigma factor (sigma-70 family)